MGCSLLAGEEEPFILVNGEGASPYVLVCEHAGNRLPKTLGTLGLAAGDLSAHIAWDIGAEGVARQLARLIDAPLALQRYSRLAYDCNRPPESPSAIPEISELTTIPGNRNLTAAQRLARVESIYRPFHHGLASVLDRRAAARKATVVLSLHSFTPVFKGKRRDLDIGILYDRDPALATRLIKEFPNLAAKLNEPYSAKDGVLHTLNMHAYARNLRHAMVEIRNDLIADPRGQDEWAQRLSVALIHVAKT